MSQGQTIVEGNNFHTKYLQYHKGYQVEIGMMNVIGQEGIVLRANGFIVRDLNVDVSNLITEETALSKAMVSIGATTFIWQDQSVIDAMNENFETVNYNNFPKGKLVITRKNGQYNSNNDAYRLAWYFTLTATEPRSISNIYIDAKTGEVLNNLGASDDYFTHNSGTGWTWYNGQFSNLGTGHCGTCSKWDLYSNKHIYTLNASNSYKLVKDQNDNWVENSVSYTSNGCDDRKTAHSAHWSIERAWDYFINRHGRWGSDYNGKDVYINVISGNSAIGYQEDAPQSNSDNIIIRKDDATITPPSSTNVGIGYSAGVLDVMCHEYSHAMIKRSSALLNYGESGALNEGFADIFGLLAERYTTGVNDWSMGEFLGITRLFANPHNDFSPSPSRYLEPSFWNTSPYNVGNPAPANVIDPVKHRNGGVLRKWFELLANGGTFNGVTVQALGIEKADDIAYITFNWWLWRSIGYVDCAKQSIAASAYTYGSCSIENKAVAAAWRAVGINIPINCLPAKLNGAPVIYQSKINEGETFEYNLSLDDGSDININNISWTIPNGWRTNLSNGKLILTGTSNYNTQLLKVSYSTSGGGIISDSMYVHFSTETVIPDNHLPPSNKSAEPLETTLSENTNVYPNPTDNFLNISLPQGFETAYISIFNLQGSLVLQSKITQQFGVINTSKLSSGLYFIKINSDNLNQTQKINIIH